MYNMRKVSVIHARKAPSARRVYSVMYIERWCAQLDSCLMLTPLPSAREDAELSYPLLSAPLSASPLWEDLGSCRLP